MKISEIKKTTSALMQRCWAELIFISLFNSGIWSALYTMVILIGYLTGATPMSGVMPLFDKYPPAFIISVAVLLIAAYILSAPLHYGIKWYCWQISANMFMPVSSILACYSTKESVFKFIKLRLLTDMRRCIPTALIASVAAIGIFLADYLLSLWEGNDIAGILIYSGILILLLGIVILCAVVNMKYIPAGYIMAENPDRNISEVLEESKAMVKKKHTAMLALYCSCGGYFLLCVLIFPLLFIIPYLNINTAVFVRSIMKEAAENAEESEVAG